MADEFEDEVSSLERQKRELETKLSKTGLLDEQNAEICQLKEELETHRNASLRMEELEKENQRLAAELKQALVRVQDDNVLGYVGGGALISTPIATLTDPLSSALRSDGNGGDDATEGAYKEKYGSLVKRFNKLYENHTDLSSAREHLQKVLTTEKEKTKRYQECYESQERKIKRRDAIIKQHEEELRRWRAHITQDVNGEGRMSQEMETTPKIGSSLERDVNLKDSSTARDSASSAPMPYEKSTGASTKRPFPSSSMSLHSAGNLIEPSKKSSRSPDDRVAAYDLPMLLPGGDHGMTERVVETEFELLEADQTNTNIENGQFTSPGMVPAQDIKEELSTNALPSPDTPVVISSRSVRKRQSRDDTIESKSTPKVKIERISSSPIGLAAIYRLDESLDLDDIGEKQITPRKGRPFLQKAVRNSSSLAVWNESQSHDHSHPTDSPQSLQFSEESPKTPASRTGIIGNFSALQPRSPNTQILPRTSAERMSKRRKIASNKDVSDLFEDGQVIQSSEKSVRKGSAPTLEQAQLLGKRLLAKPSPLKHILRQSPVTPIQTKSFRTGGSHPVSSRPHEVPQDGTPSANFLPQIRFFTSNGSRSEAYAEHSRPASRGRVQNSKEISRPSSKGSISNSVDAARPLSIGNFRDSAFESRLITRDSPDPQLESKPSKSSSRTPAQRQRPPSRDSNTGYMDLSQPTPKGMSGQLRLPQSIIKTASHAKDQGIPIPKSRPLRSLPVHQLSLQDFKINPNYNGGYDYAFNTVVRNRGERRCLQGCTKPECCGRKFRVLAEATRNPTKPPTMSQEEADQKLLEDFLGDNSFRIRNMTKAEREETLMQAMTRDFSNKYGTHRHAYERRQSPPGYWRSDFPSTQEEIQDRAKAHQMEREQVSRRYEEAMRKGAYIFRDE